MRGMGRVFRRGDIYWIAYSHRGKEYRESSRSTRESDAKRFLQRRLGELGQGTFTAPKEERVYMSELLDALEADYELRGGKSLMKYRSHLRPIREAFGSYRALDVTE
jgi:hypothetical protein